MPVRLTKEEKIKILNADDVFGIMQKILLRENKINRKREHLWAIGLEPNNQIQFIELISMGSKTKTIVEPMEVFSFALQKKSDKIILVHNHPSGELEPSEGDKDVTDRLIQVGLIVDVPVVDHLIISVESFMSFAREGLLEELGRSLKYVPPYKLAARIKELAKAEGRKEEKLKLSKEMAKKLKIKGMTPEEISEVTGLPVAEIKKIRVPKKKG